MKRIFVLFILILISLTGVFAQEYKVGDTFKDVQMVLYENGAINAIGLDGGASSCMVYQGELVNKPSEGNHGRLLPNALVFR